MDNIYLLRRSEGSRLLIIGYVGNTASHADSCRNYVLGHTHVLPNHATWPYAPRNAESRHILT